MKHQPPTTNHQEIFKRQTSRKVRRSIPPFAEMNLLNLSDPAAKETWCLFGVWVLVFGVFTAP